MLAADMYLEVYSSVWTPVGASGELCYVPADIQVEVFIPCAVRRSRNPALMVVVALLFVQLSKPIASS